MLDTTINNDIRTVRFVPQTKISDKEPGVGEACVVTDIVKDAEGIHQRWFFANYDGCGHWETMDGRRIPVHKDQYWIREYDCVPDLSGQVKLIECLGIVKFVERFGIKVPEDTPYNTNPPKDGGSGEVMEMNWRVMQEYINRLEERIEKLEDAQKYPLQPTQPYQPVPPIPVLPYHPYTPYPYTPDPLSPLGPIVTYVPDGIKHITTCTTTLGPIRGIINDPDGSVK